MEIVKNSIKMEAIYEAIYPLIEWEKERIGFNISGTDYDDKIYDRKNSLRKKYKKIMQLVIGSIPEAFIDGTSYYIDPNHVPVIAALLIRTASDRDPRYPRYRSWLSGKYRKSPSKYYSEIIEFNSEIEEMMDALYSKKIYLSEIQKSLEEKYPDIVIELPLAVKNTWEILIKDSMCINEAIMYKTIAPLIHDIELYMSVLPQVLDDGDVEKDDQRTIHNEVNFANGISLFSDEEFDKLSYSQLIANANYQEKCRNLLVQLIRRFRIHLIQQAHDRIVLMHGNAEEYLTFIANSLNYTPDETKQFIDEYQESQKNKLEVEKEADFISPTTVFSKRVQIVIDSDDSLQNIINNTHKETDSGN